MHCLPYGARDSLGELGVDTHRYVLSPRGKIYFPQEDSPEKRPCCSRESYDCPEMAGPSPYMRRVGREAGEGACPIWTLSARHLRCYQWLVWSQTEMGSALSPYITNWRGGWGYPKPP